MKPKFKVLFALAFAMAFSFSSQGQWLTQSILIKPGWTAVFLHVDASYQTIDQLVGADPNNPISQIWIWQPPPTSQFSSSPQNPVVGNSQWGTWARLGVGITGTFNALVANSAYLVYSVAPTNYTWQLQGKPVAPQYTWTTAGLNFIGFPTVPANPPMFDSYLSLAPTLQSLAQVFQYQGGPLGPTNPSQLFLFHTTPVTRGQAFWIRSGTVFNNYFGPFTVALQSSGGASFGDSVSEYGFHLRNMSVSNVTVSMKLLASETPPAGQTSIVAAPPLLLRGALVTSNLTYGFSALSVGGVQTWLLAPQGQPGSDVQVVLGLNRYLMTSLAGSQFAGILQFTDSYNFNEVDVPVSAVQSSLAGLWVGNANVTQVRNYLKNYQMDSNNVPVISSNGQYIVTSVNTNLGAVARPFPLRLIVHNDGTNAVLLQRAYYGLSPYTNLMVATSQGLLDQSHLGSARRITAAHLPWTSNNVPMPFSGQLVQGGVLTATADLPYDDQASNPFLHTYHPDHDNLDSSFQTELAQGYQSYRVTRQITLNVSPPGNDFGSLTSVGESLVGYYAEAITVGGLGGASRNFYVSGIFSLNRISPISTLNQQ